jgi:hypothetical protein
MTDNFEDEDDIETDELSSLVYEMIATLEDELKYGSSLNDRYDSFKYYFEKIFKMPIDRLDDIEGLIANQNDKINIYQTLRDEISHIYDKYFGITFNDIEKVDINSLYTIYQIIYVEFVKLLCFYALGKAKEKDIDGKQLFRNAIEENKKTAIDISDYIVGNYIMNEDEFTFENIALALDRSDTGNMGYQYLFGVPDGVGEIALGEVIIDNNAFRLRVKSEYNNLALKQLFEIVFSRLVDTLSIGG